jgi:phosphocarrier protein
MLEGIFTIRNRLGLHARAAAMFVKSAAKFNSNVLMEKDGMQVNGKSIMGVMTLAAECGSSMLIRTMGEDADTALAALADLVARGFDEAYDE